MKQNIFKQIVAITFIACSFSLSTQENHDQCLADLLQTKKWFEIEEYYLENKDKITNEFVLLWYKAETGKVFNRHSESIETYKKLIEKNPVGMDIPTLAHLFVQPALTMCGET